jgi:hypothetical protein
MGSVFVFAFTAALNPSLLAVTTLLLTLPNPKRLLVGYLLGAVGISFTFGLLLVFALSATKGAASQSKHHVSPIIDILLGAYILWVMSRIARHRDRVILAWSERRHRKQEGKPPPRWRRALADATPPKAFIVGILLTLPGASFVAGMDELSKQHVGDAVKVGLVLVFVLIQLLIIEVPLVGYFVNPAGTDAAISRFRDFLSRDGHRILLIGGTVVGLLLLARGIVQLA